MKEEAKNLSLVQKLATAREMWAKLKPKKTGQNNHQGFLYFTLEDIEPHKIKIFNELGLVDTYKLVKNETGEYFVATLHDSTSSDTLEFSVEYSKADAIVSKTGKAVNNILQQIGAGNTYLRRYLLMNILSVVEDDQIDSTIGMEVKPPEVVKEPNKKSIPLKNEERKEVIKEVIQPTNSINEMQLNALKKLLSKAKVLGYINEVQSIVDKTNGLKNISVEMWDKLIVMLGDLTNENRKQ